MLCLVARFEDKILRFPLPDSDAIVGSSVDAELCIPFPGISRRHARLTFNNGGVRLIDLGSKNRLIVGQERVDEVELTTDLEVQIGRAFLTVEDAQSSDVEIALRSTPPRRSNLSKAKETDPVHLTHEKPWRTPALALKCIREIELAGEKKLQRDQQTYLTLAQKALGSTALLILEITERGDVAIAATGGVLPEEETIDAIGRTVASAKDGSICHAKLRGNAAVLCARDSNDRRVALVAMFAGEQRALEPWETDFFEFLARRLIAFEPPKREVIETSANDGLRIPDGMVIGCSPAIRGLLRQLQITCHSQIDVLLWGETGTGKELYARMIHASGPTSEGPFIAINCAAIPSELLEAELFGVLGRVATGVDPRPGLFLEANGGTIFLDEIGELAPTLQAKLLRVLQEREVLSLGATKPRKIDVRVISASNSNLLTRVERGEFRADLYYRVRGLQFHLPPLRERREDIPELLLAFINRAAERYNKRISGVSRKALQLLTAHEWPGNVRELQNEAERAVLLCANGGALSADHFASVRWTIEQNAIAASAGGAAATAGVPGHSRVHAAVHPDPAGHERNSDTFESLQERVDAVERDAIDQALRMTRGNRTRAAKLLGITRNGLAMKMKRLGIE